MSFKCDQCAIPYGEETCVLCGYSPEPLRGEIEKPGSLPFSVREGVEVEEAFCGICGEVVISRVENFDGKVGCLRCFGSFIRGSGLPKLPEP